jgi:malate dehydrogenase (oxaloacetate-decarboxylating)
VPGVLDCTYRVQIPHRPGQLAAVCQVVADHRAVIGDVVTVNLGRHRSVREITIEVVDGVHADAIASALGALEGVTVMWHTDRALLRHEGGKLTVEPTAPVRTVQDMRDIYTPGVARVCLAIAEEPELAARYTTIGHSVAICTNGTRVLGLGDIGAVASMPVMEGKAIFYKQCIGLDAIPILVDTRDPDEFVETVVRVAPGFGGIHLEDISAPACFEIEAALIERLAKPVMHDDVHGTAVVTLSAALVACRHAGVRLEDAVVGQLGLGAAGFGIAALMRDAGVKRVLASDPIEASHARARERGIEVVDLATVMGEADVVVATTGQPGLIGPELVRRGQVILALTNPVPEIEPEAALAAGAAFAADGTSVNNVLGYPGIFRGALDAGARSITSAMKLAAAAAIADKTEESDLVPDVLDRSVHEHVAEAVRAAAAAV